MSEMNRREFIQQALVSAATSHIAFNPKTTAILQKAARSQRLGEMEILTLQEERRELLGCEDQPWGKIMQLWCQIAGDDPDETKREKANRACDAYGNRVEAIYRALDENASRVKDLIDTGQMKDDANPPLKNTLEALMKLYPPVPHEPKPELMHELRVRKNAEKAMLPGNSDSAVIDVEDDERTWQRWLYENSRCPRMRPMMVT